MKITDYYTVGTYDFLRVGDVTEPMAVKVVDLVEAPVFAEDRPRQLVLGFESGKGLVLNRWNAQELYARGLNSKEDLVGQEFTLDTEERMLSNGESVTYVAIQ
jgi:hypothetical protein